MPTKASMASRQPSSSHPRPPARPQVSNKKLGSSARSSKAVGKRSAKNRGNRGGLWGKIDRITRSRLFINLVVGYFVFTWMWVWSYSFINPFATPLTVSRWIAEGEGNGLRTGTWVYLEDMGKNVPRAAIAAEDQKFYNHAGFDGEGLRQALGANISSGSVKRGGSTISQQVAKNCFLYPSRTIWRKIFETYFTALVELFWSKDRILEVYLNSIEYGPGLFGVEAAAKNFYKRHPTRLTKQQAIELVCVLPAPRAWSPKKQTPKYRAHVRAVKRNWKYAKYPPRPL